MTKRSSRRNKDKLDCKPRTKEKWLNSARDGNNDLTLTPANANQKLAISYLRGGKSVIFLTGSAGTGKSLIAAWWSSKQLKEKRIDKVYLVRPAVSTGKSIGLLPGDIDEKLAPYFAQTLAHIESFLGKGPTKYNLDKKIIEMKAVEYLRGTSFENCVVVLEESQNFTKEEFEMLLTRLGDNCTLIFTGDTKQHDLRGNSGLSETLELLNNSIDMQPEYLSDEDLDLMEDLIGVVKFTPDDVVRSGLTKAFVKMYYNQ